MINRLFLFRDGSSGRLAHLGSRGDDVISLDEEGPAVLVHEDPRDVERPPVDLDLKESATMGVVKPATVATDRHVAPRKT